MGAWELESKDFFSPLKFHQAARGKPGLPSTLSVFAPARPARGKKKVPSGEVEEATFGSKRR